MATSVFQRNSLPLGLIIGLLSPLIGTFIVFGIFALMVSTGAMDESMGGLHSKRMRTTLLIGICTNLFWIRKWNQPFTTNSLRGVTTATMLYAIGWFVTYYDALYED